MLNKTRIEIQELYQTMKGVTTAAAAVSGEVDTTAAAPLPTKEKTYKIHPQATWVEV